MEINYFPLAHPIALFFYVPLLEHSPPAVFEMPYVIIDNLTCFISKRIDLFLQSTCALRRRCNATQSPCQIILITLTKVCWTTNTHHSPSSSLITSSLSHLFLYFWYHNHNSFLSCIITIMSIILFIIAVNTLFSVWLGCSRYQCYCHSCIMSLRDMYLLSFLLMLLAVCLLLCW